MPAPTRAALVLLAATAALVACSSSSSDEETTEERDCTCSVTVNGAESTMQCGEDSCVSGKTYECRDGSLKIGADC